MERIPSIGGYNVRVVNSHNPAQIKFEKDNKCTCYFDMDNYSQLYIEQVFTPVIEEEVKKMKAKYMLD